MAGDFIWFVLDFTAEESTSLTHLLLPPISSTEFLRLLETIQRNCKQHEQPDKTTHLGASTPRGGWSLRQQTNCGIITFLKYVYRQSGRMCHNGPTSVDFMNELANSIQARGGTPRTVTANIFADSRQG